MDTSSPNPKYSLRSHLWVICPNLAIQAEQNPINRVLMSFGDRVPLRTRLDLGKNVY
jgi:hypothetical protein